MQSRRSRGLGGMKMMMFLTAVACLEVILSRLAMAYLGCLVAVVSIVEFQAQGYTKAETKKIY